MPELSRDEAEKKVNTLPQDKRNQTAIVNLMNGVGQIKKIVHQIPGGRTLTETEDESTLPAAVFNWVRRAGTFERFEISLIGEYDHYEDLADKGFKPRKKMFEDFMNKSGLPPYWQRKGLKHLANVVAKALAESENPIAIIAEKDGLYVITDGAQKFTPESEEWNPTLIIHQVRRV